jgi:ATP-binding cassette subfamily F protein 3
MIQLSGAGKRFGPKLLFEDLNWMITPQDRAGLVGANGSGKTTLLKVLAGLESLDYGKLSVTRGVSSGYLPQDGLSLSGRSVFAECMSVFASLQKMEIEMEELTHKMADLDPAGPEYADVAERFHQLDSEFRTRDGYAIEAQVGTVLAGLGFPHDEWSKRTEEFSGGWQMRIALAKLLLEKPNLLLLDEPTNHLDLEARTWLEQYLATYPFAIVLISHDRYFLDVTVNKIVEIWNRGVHFYSGNYEKYLRQKQERSEQLEAAYRNQRDRIEQLEAFINRFRYQATKAKQVQSRIKELEKIERIELPNEEKTIHFSFPQPKPSGRIVAEFQKVSKSYGEKFVFGGVDFIIERGDRIALVGVNGAGKSTLIKLLAGTEPLSSGEYRLGHNAEVDYFAQDQYKELDPNARMLDDLQGQAPRSSNTELRSLLGCFLFSEDDVFKRIGVLSGGERNRYALARMLLQPSNFLLLDEPTNHLDMRAKDVLLESLEKYTGTVVFVSHDRYFIDKLATRVFEVGAGEVHVFPGNYEDYVWRKEGKQIDLSLPVNGHPAANRQLPIPNPQQAAKRLNPMKLKKLQDRARELETQIAALEADIASDEASLANFVSA